jgi:hypothetical protein
VGGAVGVDVVGRPDVVPVGIGVVGDGVWDVVGTVVGTVVAVVVGEIAGKARSMIWTDPDWNNTV